MKNELNKNLMIFKFKNFIFMLIIFIFSFQLIASDKSGETEVPEGQSVIRCRQKDGTIRTEYVKLNSEFQKVGRYSVCHLDFDKLSYDMNSCQAYEDCQKIVFSNVRTDQNELQTKMSPFLLQSTADGWARDMIARNSENILEQKTFKKYSEKLGIKFSDGSLDCDSHLRDACNKEDLERNFLEVNQHCKKNSGENGNCFNLDDPTYTSIELKEENSTNLKSDIYLDRIAENRALEMITNEASHNYYAQMASIIQESETTLLAYKKIRELFVSQNQQPLRFGPFLNRIKGSDTFLEEMINDLKKNKFSKSQEYADEILKKRSSYLQIYASEKHCSKFAQLNTICELKNKILNALDDVAPLFTAENVKDVFKGEDYRQGFEVLKKVGIPLAIENSDEYGALLRRERCLLIAKGVAVSEKMKGKGRGPAIVADPIGDQKTHDENGDEAKLRYIKLQEEIKNAVNPRSQVVN